MFSKFFIKITKKINKNRKVEIAKAVKVQIIVVVNYVLENKRNFVVNIVKNNINVKNTQFIVVLIQIRTMKRKNVKM